MNELNVYQIAGQVACGMHHLKKLRIIHGDLAARNVLVGEVSLTWIVRCGER